MSGTGVPSVIFVVTGGKPSPGMVFGVCQPFQPVLRLDDLT